MLLNYSDVQELRAGNRITPDTATDIQVPGLSIHQVWTQGVQVSTPQTLISSWFSSGLNSPLRLAHEISIGVNELLDCSTLPETKRLGYGLNEVFIKGYFQLNWTLLFFP